MRPIYETQADLVRERDVVAAFAAHFKLRTIKLPSRYPLDFAVVRRSEDNVDSITAFGEVKVRTHSYGDYPTAIIAVGKWVECMALCERTNTRLLLLVGWDSGKDVRWVDLRALTGPPAIAPGGRRDRSDVDDEEPVVHIPIHVFRQIPAPPEPERKPEPETPPETPDQMLERAKRMAFNGEDVGKLVARLGPENAARLRVFVQGLPEETRNKTIYGRSNPPAASKTAQKRP